MIPSHRIASGRRWALFIPLFAALANLLCAAAEFDLDGRGALKKLSAGGAAMVLDPASGGFSAHDVVAKAAIDLTQGKVSRKDGKTIFDAKPAQGLGLHAEFTAKDGYVLVTGYLEKSTPEDRAIILDYRVGLTGAGAIFSNALNRSEESRIADATTEFEGNAFPIAALQTADRAVAVAIPHDFPCAFGMVGSGQGLTVRFFLGVTAETKAFPNRAPFQFIIYPTEPGWGFRGALERYYGFYPGNYEPRIMKTGYWMFQVKGLVPERADQYTFNLLEIQNPHVPADLNRDDKYDIASLLYTLVGQREIKFLDKLPTNYDEAMKVFADWSVESHKKHTVTKENIVTGEDKWLREEVEISGIKNAEGKYEIQFRDTPWGKKSLTFKANPSPYLYADKNVQTVGRNSIRLVEEWLKQYPQIDGVLIDSMGANWPATADYRRDHIAYAQYPVTFDVQGRLFVSNHIGHYEWCQQMGDKLWAQGKFFGANGLYAYRASNLEHYRNPDRKTRPKLSPFFSASLLDASTSEIGTRAGTDRCQDVRILMGRKYCTLTNYEWHDEAKVKEFYNRSLAHAIFASNTMTYAGNGEYVENVNEGLSYVDNPKGYYRDKTLLDWMLPKVTMLQKAGWQPITRARVEGDAQGVVLERFGQGDKIFLTLFNETDARKTCSVKLDLAALGFEAGTADYREIAYDTPVKTEGHDRFEFSLEPRQAYVVIVSKIWKM